LMKKENAVAESPSDTMAGPGTVHPCLSDFALDVIGHTTWMKTGRSKIGHGLKTAMESGFGEGDIGRTPMNNAERSGYNCNFCGKTEWDVTTMICGPGVYICNECVEICNGIIADWEAEKLETEKRTQIFNETWGTDI